jgi:cytochrome c553
VKIATTLLLSCMAMAAAAGQGGAVPLERCVACHGADGIGLDPLWPNLAGQKRGYLVKQLRAYRDGSRSNQEMLPLVLELTDGEIDALAAYYAGLPRSRP